MSGNIGINEGRYMKIVIYGIGKGYSVFFERNNTFLKRNIHAADIQIIGFVDGNRALWGTKVTYDRREFIIQNIEDFSKAIVEGVIVTTELFFEEIKEELVGKGYREEQIFLINELYDSYLGQLFSKGDFENKIGLEIGGPTDLFYRIYEQCQICDNVNFSSDTVWWKNETNDYRYKNKVLGNTLILEATHMTQIQNETYDFVISSNNLEHIANPLKALKEFARVTKVDGTVLVIVPRKEETFDRNREDTPFEHLLEDYKNDVGEDDLAHLSEIIEKHDYNMDIGCGGKENFIKRAKKNIENRCLHHHVFNEKCLRKSFIFAGLEILDFAEIIGNWFVVGKKREQKL